MPVGDAEGMAATLGEVLDELSDGPPEPVPREAWSRWETGSAVEGFHDLFRKVWYDDATSRHSRS